MGLKHILKYKISRTWHTLRYERKYEGKIIVISKEMQIWMEREFRKMLVRN